MKVRRMRDRRDQASAASLVRGAGLLAALSAAALLAGCSSVPDEVNPVEWYRGASAWVAGDEEESTASSLAEPATEDVPFPNLASVPERPEPTPEPAAVEEMIASLEADRGAAQVADAELRSRPVASAVTEARVPLPTPSADDLGASRRFPPLELPDLRSALGDTETVRTGRFSDVEREQEGPTATPAPRSATPAATPASPSAAPAAAPRSVTPAAMPEPRATPPRPARSIASARDVAPRLPIQPPEPFSTGRRSFASATGASPAAAPSASARVTPRPPVQPPRPYSAPRSSMSEMAPAAAGAEVSLAELAR